MSEGKIVPIYPFWKKLTTFVKDGLVIHVHVVQLHKFKTLPE
jgi:hypothetical protein